MPYCGREFTASEIDLIRELIALSPPLSRYRLSREVCERLNWRRADGRLKDMSCRGALLKMQADALFSLPPPRNAQPVRYREHPGIERAVLAPTITPSVNLGTLSVELVVKKRDSLLWNAYIERHHYLRHQPLPGAQLRYFRSDHPERELGDAQRRAGREEARLLAVERLHRAPSLPEASTLARRATALLPI